MSRSAEKIKGKCCDVADDGRQSQIEALGAALRELNRELKCVRSDGSLGEVIQAFAMLRYATIKIQEMMA